MLGGTATPPSGPPPQASTTAEKVKAEYKLSVSDPGAFWAVEAMQYHWETPFDPSNVYSANFKRSEGPIFAEWFAGGTTNVCYNAARPRGRQTFEMLGLRGRSRRRRGGATWTFRGADRTDD